MQVSIDYDNTQMSGMVRLDLQTTLEYPPPGSRCYTVEKSSTETSAFFIDLLIQLIDLIWMIDLIDRFDW